MEKVNGGELAVRALIQAGVDTVFTLHGGHLDPIYQALLDRGVRVIDTRHEQAAAHAADGWARATGRVGVCLVTAGPGFTDCITGLANAYLDCMPLLVIAGAAPLREAELLPLQGGIDQTALAAPVTKWAHRITHTERIGDILAQAIRTATTGQPGPVYVEIPIDVLFHRVDATRVQPPPASLVAQHRPAPPPAAVDQTLDLLAKAERPALFVGGGAWLSGVGDVLARFAERVRCPVFANPKAHGIVPPSSPVYGGRFHSLRAAGKAAGADADLVVLLGARQGLHTGGRGSPLIPRTATLVQIDVAAEEIGRNRPPDIGIVADCREAVLAMDAAAASRAWPERTEWLDAVARAATRTRSQYRDVLEAASTPIHPFRLAVDVLDALPEDAIVCVDGGEIANWVEMAGAPTAGGRWTNHGYLGCLGTGLPFALAAKAAHPDTTVCCITGDGSVGFNFMELDTMVRHRLPVITVVSNDQIWGMSAHAQDLMFGDGRRVASELGLVRYDLAAAGLGCHAELVEDPAEIRPAVERALASGRPSLINVLTDPAVVHPGTVRMSGSSRRPAAGDGASAKGPDGSAEEKIAIPYYEHLDANA